MRLDQALQRRIPNRKYLEQIKRPQCGQGFEDVSFGGHTLRGFGRRITPDLRIGQKSAHVPLADDDTIAFDLVQVIGKDVFGSHDIFSA